MTDEEIEKALEICKSESLPCYECAYWNISTQGYNCRNALIRDVFDYINRLKAENAMLRISDDSKGKCTLEQHGEIHRLQDELKQVRKDTAKEIFQAIYNWEEIGFFKIKWFAKEYYGIEVDDK